MRFFFLFFLLQLSLFAQKLEPITFHLTEKDGLPDIEIYDIIEDKKGFIWIAANKGLYRYDGKEFKKYTHSEKKGLSVFGLKFDYQNRLWCNNISGQFFFINSKDELEYFSVLKNHKGQLSEFFFYKEKIITFFHGKTLEIDLKTKESRSLLLKNKWWDTVFIQNDTLFGTFKNWLQYKKGEEISTKCLINPKYFKKGLTKSFKIGDNYFLQSVNKKGASIYNLKTSKGIINISQEIINQKEFIRYVFKEDNFIWFCVDKGVYKYKLDGNRFVFVEHLFSDKIITKIIKDKNNNYWFATLRNGIFIIPNIAVKKYKNVENITITSLEKLNDSTIVYGLMNGNIYSRNIITNKVKKYPEITSQKVEKLAYNGKDKLLISFQNQGYLLDINKKTYKLLNIGRNRGNAKDISFINSDEFLFAGYNFSDVVNIETKSHKKLASKRSYVAHFNKKTNNLYVGFVNTTEGFNNNLESEVITYKGKNFFTSDIDNTIDGTVWFATFTDGIIGINESKTFNYTIKNGLLSNEITKIKTDNELLWIVTSKGIQCLNTKTKIFRSITSKDGVSFLNIYDLAVCDNKLILATNKGMYEIDKGKVFSSKKISDFYFAKIMVEDEEVPIKNKYNLSPETDKVQFQFHTNGFMAEKHVKYLYKLKDNQKKWTVLPENSNQVTFNNLSADTYNFQLKKVSTINNQETSVKNIRFKINKPFYKKLSFIILTVTGLILLIITYFKKKLQKQEKEKRLLLEQAAKEKELVFLKLENLRSQMNPHFVFNALNSIQEYILLNQKNLAGDYLGKFADLIRMYLYQSTQAFITISEEEEALEQYLELEKLRFEDLLNYSITIKGIADKSNIQIPTMLVQPYVENALKHGLLHRRKERELNIVFELIPSVNYITCIITDNGIGREKSKELKELRNIKHKSFATKANKDRLTLLNYERKEKIGVKIIDLYTENNEAKGTQVIIKIPFKYTT